MSKELTIVMYHYVRPIIGSEYPGIKGLEIEKFKKQLDYFEENYSIINTEDLIESVLNNKSLPPNPCWLTFDDGYKDHFQYVMPELMKRKITGAFFPPKVAITDSKLLDVNSIHHILSCNKSSKRLLKDLNNLCLENGVSNEKLDLYYNKYGIADRFDEAEIIYIKRMLQHVLPENLRNKIVSILFKKYVGISEKELSKKLYMNINEVTTLVKNGMYVGSHGCMHYWLDKINEDEQLLDIKNSLEFLEEINAPTSNWIMNYPYGSYNSATLSILKKFGALIGITTEARIASIKTDNLLTLPRFDTNDFPQYPLILQIQQLF